MGHGGTDETPDGPQQVCSKSMKERANGKERGRRAVSISSSSEPTCIEESASGIRVIGGLEKSNRRKRALPAEGDTAEPKPK